MVETIFNSVHTVEKLITIGWKRTVEDFLAFAMGYALASYSTANDEEICYGADISTLTRMIESGEI